MRISQVINSLEADRKTMTKEDRRDIRKAAKVLRNPKASTQSRYEALALTPISDPTYEYFEDMKVKSKRGWNYVADRLEGALGYKVPRKVA